MTQNANELLSQIVLHVTRLYIFHTYSISTSSLFCSRCLSSPVPQKSPHPVFRPFGARWTIAPRHSTEARSLEADRARRSLLLTADLDVTSLTSGDVLGLLKLALYVVPPGALTSPAQLRGGKMFCLGGLRWSGMQAAHDGFQMVRPHDRCGSIISPQHVQPTIDLVMGVGDTVYNFLEDLGGTWAYPRAETWPNFLGQNEFEADLAASTTGHSRFSGTSGCNAGVSDPS